MSLSLPADVEQVIREFRTCEFSTLARDGTPITWPTVAVYEPESGQFLITSSIGLPAKAFNARREPRVSLLFSDPTASGLKAPPAVLVQGRADVLERISTGDDIEHYWQVLFERQPSSRLYTLPLMRQWMDWYYMRLVIRVTPRRLYRWPAGDFSRPPERVAEPDAA